jgi:glycosyltransferase involved in cell wall biosynthesis
MGGHRVKVLYLSRAYSTHDRRFLSAFVDAGFATAHLPLVGDALDRRPLPAGVEALRWVGDSRALHGFTDYLVRLVALRRLLAIHKPHVVVAGPVQSGAFLVALSGYRPLVTMSWGSDMLVDAQRSRWLKTVTRFALRRSSGFIGDCRAVRDAIAAFTPVTDERGVFVPWGIDAERFSPGPSRLELRQELGWGNDPVLICTRSWEPIYAIDVLIRAFARVRVTHPRARLLLIGSGSQASSINSLIASLGLGASVHAAGRVDNDLLPDYFRLSDVYVSAALSDGTSISLLEAMACGLPVVVTEGYGNLEWVASGINGWLAKPGDEHSLARELNTALSCSNCYTTISRINIDIVLAKAHWKQNAMELSSLLQRVASHESQYVA